MADVFSVRSLIYWWGFLSATLFVREWLKNLAAFLLSSPMFGPGNMPFSLVPGVNSWIDGAAEYLKAGIKFDPTQDILTIGSFHVLGWILAVGFGLILFGMVAYVYIRALTTSTWLDDFLALLAVYVVLRIEGHIVAIADLPIQSGFRAFVNNPVTAFLVLLTLLLILVFLGEGFRSKRAFWRAIIEAIVLAVFVFPHETANLLGRVIQVLGDFGQGLYDNTTFAVVWGIIGMYLALQHLTSQEAAGGAKSSWKTD